MANNKIGEAYVEVTADTRNLEAGLRSAERTTEQAGRKMGGAFQQVGTKIDAATAGVRKFSSAITGSIGAVTGIIGVITTLLALLAALAVRLGKAREEAEKMRANFKTLQEQVRDFAQETSDNGINPIVVQMREVREEAVQFRREVINARKESQISFEQEAEIINAYNKAVDARLRSLFEELLAVEELAKKEESRIKIANELSFAIDDNRKKLKAAREEAEKYQTTTVDFAKQVQNAQAASEAAENRRLRQLQDQIRQLEQIRNLQREINSLGVGGSGGNVGAATNALGANRIRKGP